jgi:hypothetical protein
MKLIALPAILAGLLLAILILRVGHGNYAELGTIGLWTGGVNAFTVLLAVALFRGTSSEANIAKLLLALGYVTGVVIGTYLYYS